MGLSKLRNIIASKIQKKGSEYTCNGKTIRALILKAQVSYDRPVPEYTLLAGYNASLTDGYLIEGQGEHFIPTKTEKPNILNDNVQYIRGYCRNANASIDISSYTDPSNASKDTWDQPSGTEGTDWGWIIQKHSVWVNFERMEMRPQNERIGQIENAEYLVTIPWSVNASISLNPEYRITDRNSKNWKVLDVDDKTYLNQSYILRVSNDDR